MIVHPRLRHVPCTKLINSCVLCTIKNANKAESLVENKKKKRRPISEKYLEETQHFLKQDPKMKFYRTILPQEIQTHRTYKKPAHIYLICPDIATEIANHICRRVSPREVIAETNPGLALISQRLLEKEFKKIILYEQNLQFYKILQEKFEKNDNRIILHKMDFFYLKKYVFMDKVDQEKKLPLMFKELPKKNWSQDPFLTIVGTMTSMDFVKYLVKSIILQNEISLYGRFDLFLLTYQSFCSIIEGTKDTSKIAWTYLFEIFFEVEHIDKFPRKYFLPWERQKIDTKKSSFDTDNIYFIRVTVKKDLPISPVDLAPFFFFLMYLYGRGGNTVISTCEKWLPNCGETLLLPKLKHSDYYDDLHVFTKFKELNLKHTIALYREFANHSNFKNSPFMSMMESEWMKSETIQTSLNEPLTKKSDVP